MELLLGLDVGTTATKALLIDVKGKIVASASYNYGLITPPINRWRYSGQKATQEPTI